MNKIGIFKNKICLQFHFEPKEREGEPADSLIFLNREKLFRFNFVTETVSSIHNFAHTLNRMPTLMQPNDSQDVIFVGSPEDGIFLLRSPNTAEFIQKNVLKANYIKKVKSVAYDVEEGVFYIMCNWFAEKLGFYVVKVDPRID